MTVVRVRHAFIVAGHVLGLARLRDLLRAGCGWERGSAPGYSRPFTWFSAAFGDALALVMVGAGLGAMILPVVAQSIISRSGWARSVCVTRRPCIVTGLALVGAYIRERGGRRATVRSIPHSGMTWQQACVSVPFWILHCPL